MSAPRSLAELRDVLDPAWPDLETRIRGAAHGVEVLPVDPRVGEQALLRLQLFADTALGAIALHTGGMFIDAGWLRLLGAGSSRMEGTLLNWNGLSHPPRFAGLSGAFIVGHDVIGGLFAVNAGGLPGPPGGVCYLSPDVLQWQEMGGGFTSFLDWALDGDLAGFYNAVRWNDWEETVERLTGDLGLHRDPPPWTISGQRAVSPTTTIMTMGELIGAHVRRIGPKSTEAATPEA